MSGSVWVSYITQATKLMGDVRLVMYVALFPMPALIAYMKYQKKDPPDVVAGKRGPKSPFVSIMQNANSPMMAGVTKKLLHQKNLFN